MPKGIGYGKTKGKKPPRYDGKRQSAMAKKLRTYGGGTVGGAGAG